MEAPHPPAHRPHCQRPHHRTAQKRGAGVQDDQDISSAPQCGTGGQQCPWNVPLGRTSRRGYGQGQREGHRALQSGPNFQLKIRMGALISRTCSCCLHTTSLVTRAAPRAGLLGHCMAAHVSHDSPTWMAEGTRERRAGREMAGKSEEGTAGSCGPQVTEEPALLCTFLSPPAFATHLCQGRDACLVGSLDDSMCKCLGPWLGG